ncbi:hypothetical protein MNEG_12196, partial [Monoraphidium neglectum]
RASPAPGSCAAAAAAAAQLPGLQPLWSPGRVGAAAGGDAVPQRGADSPRGTAAAMARKQQPLGHPPLSMPPPALARPLGAAGGGRLWSPDAALPDGTAAAAGGRPPLGAHAGAPCVAGGAASPPGGAGAGLLGCLGAMKAVAFPEDLDDDVTAFARGPLITTEVVPDYSSAPQPPPGSGGARAPAAAAAGAGPSPVLPALRAVAGGEEEGSFSNWMAFASQMGMLGGGSSSGGGDTVAVSSLGPDGAQCSLGHRPRRGDGAPPPWPPAVTGKQAPPAPRQPGMTRHSSICLDACAGAADQGPAPAAPHVPPSGPGPLAAPAPPAPLGPGAAISHAFEMPSFFCQASPSAGAGGAEAGGAAPRLPARPATAEPIHGHRQWVP